MFKLWPDKDITVKKAKAGRVPLLILSPKGGAKNAPGVLWIHGGGYVLGMKEMVYMGRAEADVYPSDMHAFDMLTPEKEISRQATERFNEKFEYAMRNYFREQNI